MSWVLEVINSRTLSSCVLPSLLLLLLVTVPTNSHSLAFCVLLSAACGDWKLKAQKEPCNASSWEQDPAHEQGLWKTGSHKWPRSGERPNEGKEETALTKSFSWPEFSLKTHLVYGMQSPKQTSFYFWDLSCKDILYFVLLLETSGLSKAICVCVVTSMNP